MSTTTFDGTDAAIIRGGLWSAPFANAGITIRQRVGGSSDFRVVATGTECRVQVFADGSTHRWTVDGGSEQTAAPGGNVNDYITLFTGLSDAAHTVINYAGTYVAETPIMLEVTGGSPAIAAPANYTNTQYRIWDASGLSTDGSANNISTDGYDETIQFYGSCRFKATTSIIRVWGKKQFASDRIGLVVDGDLGGITLATQPDAYSWTSFTGLDGGGEHTYRIVQLRGDVCYSIMVPGGSLNTTALTPWAMAYFIGNSITAGTGLANGTETFVEHFGVLTDRGWYINGSPGQTAFGYGQTHAGDPGAANPEPQLVFIMWGMNDQATGSGVDTTEFRAAVEDIIDTVVADLPSAQVYWPGIIPVAASLDNRAVYNAEISGYIGVLANPNVHYINSDAWVVSTSDGTHPDAAGAAAMAEYLAAAVDPESEAICHLKTISGWVF